MGMRFHDLRGMNCNWRRKMCKVIVSGRWGGEENRLDETRWSYYREELAQTKCSYDSAHEYN